MPESIAAQLRRRFPTMETLNSVTEISRGRTALAKELGTSRQALNDHVKWLKKGSLVRGTEPNNKCDMTNGELDARIKEMFGRKYDEVKVYRIGDGFQPGQTGTEGLEFVRTEESRTGLSLWARDGGVSD
jgi:hypothetical protein